MDLPDVISHILSKPGAEETLPFGPETLVYKVGGKMFALTSPDEFPPRLNLKCDPERALDLRDTHESIIPGWHMNKRHWNTLILDGRLSAQLVCGLIDHSYDLVVASLPAAVRLLISGNLELREQKRPLVKHSREEGGGDRSMPPPP
jgi:predicted DNA-binding protein (MmcQ/YjbR family)